MVLEATMICVDNSEWMRNGDYPPSRFQAQADAVYLVSGGKTESDPHNTVGVMTMAGDGVRVLVTPTTDHGKILICMHGLEVGGEANLTVAIQVAQLALKNRRNKEQKQRIVVFVGSPIKCEKNVLEAIGKSLKKSNVSLDVVDFGEPDDGKPGKLEALVAAVNNGGNSQIIHIPPGKTALFEVLISSAILTGDGGRSEFAAASSEVSGFEFGVDPNVDPDLALALRLSMEEEKARQESAAKKAEESSKAENKGESKTLNSDDVVMTEAEHASNRSIEDEEIQLKDEDMDLLSVRSFAPLSGYAKHRAAREANAKMSDVAGHGQRVALALQMSVQEERTSTPSDMTKVLEDQSLMTFILGSLPGVDPNDPSIKDLLASLHGKDEQEKPDKKEDKPEDD